ncbi:hypothetical protein [Streptomyces sp. NRRL F-5053]|uniref:hypothetical protein n=1 Tax=Streptomyces sp. NRRL F-5053 TaxID=1463854 RepID=UPI001331BC7D|nr:hypothetical protein [Streptomyces sp. NRRL F-5053]
MAGSRRVWSWIGGTWIVLVAAGGVGTLVLEPGPAEEPDRPSHGNGTSTGPSLVDRGVPEGCEDEEAEARREAQKQGRDTYAVLCITQQQAKE